MLLVVDDDKEVIWFCVVICYDFIWRDDLDNGYKIYFVMEVLEFDFYVYVGDIEYYDKLYFYVMIEVFMFFKWNRFFVLFF